MVYINYSVTSESSISEKAVSAFHSQTKRAKTEGPFLIKIFNGAFLSKIRLKDYNNFYLYIYEKSKFRI